MMLKIATYGFTWVAWYIVVLFMRKAEVSSMNLSPLALWNPNLLIRSVCSRMHLTLGLFLCVILVSPLSVLADVIVDNGDAGTSKSGTWYIAGAPNFYGTNSRYSSKVDATYTFVASLTPGEYQVHAWWTQYKKRRTSVPYDIQHLGGTDTVTVNQRENGGKWNLLGTYSFDTSATIVLRSLGNGSTSADAVMFVPTGGGGNATPVLSTISDRFVNAGETFSFTVSATDDSGPPLLDATGLPPGASLTDHADGTATFTWNTIAGDIGNHPVTFTATDASDPTLVDSELVTLGVIDDTADVIVDNGDAGTSKSGTWNIAGAPNPFGTNSSLFQ